MEGWASERITAHIQGSTAPWSPQQPLKGMWGNRCSGVCHPPEMELGFEPLTLWGQ